MRVRILMPSSIAKSLKLKLHALIAQFESESYDYEYDSTVIIDPGQFRALEDLVQRECKGRGRIDILDHKIVHDDVVGEDQLTSIDDIKPLNNKQNNIQGNDTTDSINSLSYTPTLPPVIDDESPTKRNKKGKSKPTVSSHKSTTDVESDMSNLTIDKPIQLKTRKQLKKQAKKQQQLLAKSTGSSDSESDDSVEVKENPRSSKSHAVDRTDDSD